MRCLVACLTAMLFACGKKAEGPARLDLSFLDTLEQERPSQEYHEVGGEALNVDENFLVAYAYAGRPSTSVAGRHEFRVADPRDSDPTNDTLLFASGTGGVDCSNGCMLDESLQFLAVAGRALDKDGLVSLKVYDISNAQAPTLVGSEILDVTRAVWAGSVLYYTRKTTCPAGALPVTKCFELYKYDVKSHADPIRLTSMPPLEEENLQGRYQYNGYFTMGEDNETVVFFVPTYESLSVWIYKDGKRRKVLGPICAAKDEAGNCIEVSGSGATYREDNPVGLSKSGVLVFPLLEENRQFKIYRYRLGDEPRFSVLLDVPQYLSNVCYNRQEWQFTEIRGPVRFSRDESMVYFIGVSKCGENQKKPWTNILGVEVKKIGAGAPLRKDDFVWVTNNPQGYTANAIAITYYDFSPSGRFVALVGTPTVAMDGTPLPTTKDGRHERDLEVHITRADGGTRPVQITNDVEWIAQTVLPFSREQ